MKLRTGRMQLLWTSSMESFLSLQAGSNFRKNLTLVIKSQKLSISSFYKNTSENKNFCCDFCLDYVTVRCVDNIYIHFESPQYQSDFFDVWNCQQNTHSNFRTQRTWGDMAAPIWQVCSVCGGLDGVCDCRAICAKQVRKLHLKFENDRIAFTNCRE